MKRSIHIFVSLLAVILLVRPFDCFAKAKPHQAAMDCCLKGNCAPTAKADDCCKTTAPDDGQIVLAKANIHPGPLVSLAVAPVSMIPDSLTGGSIESLSHPPRSPGLNARSLPLLI